MFYVTKIAVLFPTKAIKQCKIFSFGSFNNRFRSSLNRTFASDAFLDGLPTMQSSKSPRSLKEILKRRITRVGPMTVADFMQQSLTNPTLVIYFLKIFTFIYFLLISEFQTRYNCLFNFFNLIIIRILSSF